jgi:hypothetical protein
MKKIFLLMNIIFLSQIGYSQYGTNNVNVTVKKDPNDFSSSFNQGMQAGAAARQANAASNAVYNEAMKDNYSKISIDNLVNNTNRYEYVFLESVSGWKTGENKRDILKILKGANKFQIIDESELPSEFLNNPKVLLVSWMREAQGDVNRITQLSIKNFEGNVLYESTSKNLSHQEILKPLISNYIYTKEIALSKIEEYKKYLDLGVISKEEYDMKVAELKPILLGEN